MHLLYGKFYENPLSISSETQVLLAQKNRDLELTCRNDTLHKLHKMPFFQMLAKFLNRNDKWVSPDMKADKT